MSEPTPLDYQTPPPQRRRTGLAFAVAALALHAALTLATGGGIYFGTGGSGGITRADLPGLMLSAAAPSLLLCPVLLLPLTAARPWGVRVTWAAGLIAAAAVAWFAFWSVWGAALAAA